MEDQKKVGAGVVRVFGNAWKVIIHRNGSWWIRAGWQDGLRNTCDVGNVSHDKTFSMPLILWYI